MDATDDRRLTILRALADPTRLAMVDCLQASGAVVALGADGSVRGTDGVSVGAVCCHLTGTHAVTATLSHHLRILREAGIVRTERRGRHLICSLVESSLDPLYAWLESPTRSPSATRCAGC